MVTRNREGEDQAYTTESIQEFDLMYTKIYTNVIQGRTISFSMVAYG